MAKVKIEGTIDHLDREMRRALEETLNEHCSNQDFDIRAIFRTFKSQVDRKYSNCIY